MNRACRCLNCIMPPHLLRKLLESADADIRQAALSTMLTTAQMRGERLVRGVAFASAPAGGRRTIFDARNRNSLTFAQTARTEQGAVSKDASVNRAFEGFGITRDFYREVMKRNSIDDKGMRLDGYVHRGRRFNNAFWDGREMVFGDGDGILFTDFTASLDVIAHELTHGVTEHTAGLEYHNQSGALNESMSDVFGSLVKQWSKKQRADAADWLIGAEVFTPSIKADALRSMKAPGTAYDNDRLGKDPQPDHMDRYAELPDSDDGDNGGVHINSGIPNKAFFLAATGIGGFAWEAPGHIWYEALRASGPNTDFQEFADTTHAKAGQLYGAGSMQAQAVRSAWAEVGIRVAGDMDAVARAPRETDTLAALVKQVAALSDQVTQLSRELSAQKAR